MVLFYAPWSEDAKLVAPHFDALAQQYRHLSNVFITRVDVSKHLRVHERMRKTKLPFFLVYDDVPEAVRDQMTAKDRKVPRLLTSPRPTRQELGEFLLNQVSADAGKEWVGEWFVPYGDEKQVPPTVKYTSEVDEDESIKSAHAEWNALQRRTHGHTDSDDDRRGVAAAPELSLWRPVALSSVEEATTFVSTYAATRGSLMFFSASWCKHCPAQYRTFLAGASKVASSIAVGVFNVSRSDDSRQLKKAPFNVTVFPTVLLFGGAEAGSRVEYTEKLRGPYAASALVKFVASTTTRLGLSSPSVALPVYPTEAPRAPQTEAKAGPAPPTDNLPAELASLDDVSKALQHYMDVSNSSSSLETPAAILFLNASWCSHAKCGAALRTVVAATHALIAAHSHERSSITAYRLDLSNKRVKALIGETLGVTSVPSIVIMCNGTVHRFTQDTTVLKSASVVATRVVSFAEEVCFGLLPLEVQRKRLQDALEEAEEGELTRMSVSSILSPESGDNIFAMKFNGTTCSRDPHCIEATRLMRLLSGTYKNRRLVFAAVDASLPENEDKAHRATDDTTSPALEQHRTGSVRLTYYPVEQPPVQYEGDLDKSELIAFLDDEERRSRDSTRRI